MQTRLFDRPSNLDLYTGSNTTIKQNLSQLQRTLNSKTMERNELAKRSARELANILINAANKGIIPETHSKQDLAELIAFINQFLTRPTSVEENKERFQELLKDFSTPILTNSFFGMHFNSENYQLAAIAFGILILLAVLPAIFFSGGAAVVPLIIAGGSSMFSGPILHGMHRHFGFGQTDLNSVGNDFLKNVGSPPAPARPVQTLRPSPA